MSNNKPHFEMLSIEDIELDKDNPRIARWLKMYGEDVTAEGIALALGAGSSDEGESGPTFMSLKQSIRTNKGIIHPIIVNRKLDGKVMAIEGNTRVMIYKEFKEKKVDGDWDKIPSIVYENMTKDMIDAIRLQAHLVGPRPWDPYSKAKYLDSLYNGKNLTIDQVIDFCGGAKKEVINYIAAYQDMEKYYRTLVDDNTFDPTRFSAFVELQGKVSEALIGRGYTKTQFSEWVRDRKFSPLDTIRKLPRILQDDKASKVFLKSGAKEAIKLLEAPTPEAVLADATLEQLAREIYKRINEMPYNEMVRLRSESESEEVTTIIDAKEALDALSADIASGENK